MSAFDENGLSEELKAAKNAALGDAIKKSQDLQQEKDARSEHRKSLDSSGLMGAITSASKQHEEDMAAKEAQKAKAKSMLGGVAEKAKQHEEGMAAKEAQKAKTKGNKVAPDPTEGSNDLDDDGSDEGP